MASTTTDRPSVQDLASFRLPDGFRGRSGVVVQLWWIIQAVAFRPSPQFMYGWRNWLLRVFGADIGKDVIIRPTARITYPWKLKIGDRSWVGDYVELYNLADIEIECDAVVSQYSYLCTGSHDHESPAFDIYAKSILIEAEAWVASGAFVYPGVTVRRGSVVAARSVVTADTSPYWIHAGSPAKPVKLRVRE